MYSNEIDALFSRLDEILLLLKEIRDNTQPKPKFESGQPILLQEDKNRCPKCGMEIPEGGMGYVCNFSDCPLQPKAM